MAEARQRRRTTRDEDTVPEPAPAEVHPSIALLRGKHRAAHPNAVSSFERVDGRGKADTDWADYHLQHIALWDRRADQVVCIDDGEDD